MSFDRLVYEEVAKLLDATIAPASTRFELSQMYPTKTTINAL
jgi:hypothetical protein